MFAARNGDVEMGKVLIAAGADVNALSADGTHVLPYAVMQGQEAFAMFLLENGANPNATIDGVPALHAAAGPVGQWLIEWQRRHGASTGPLTFALGAGGGATATGAPRQGAARQRRRPERTHHHVDDVHGLHRIPDEGRVRTVCDRHRRHARRHAALGGRLRRQRRSACSAAAARPLARPPASGEVIKALLAAGANPHLTTVDGTTPLMVAAGMGRATFQPGLQRGRRSTTAEEAVNILLDAGSNINAVNEADFAAIHGAAFRGLNEVIEILVKRGADINARDYRGRTPYRIAEGAKQSFQFQAYPETAEFIKSLGANTRLGVPGTVQERARDLVTEAAALRGAPAGQA